MALEQAQYISQLVATNPLSTDTVSQAGDHMRLIKQALKNTFPNMDGPVTVTPSQMNFPIPQGGIILWSGAVLAVPTGFALCDGTNGTPDLRNRFVVGAGSTYAPNAIGGSSTTGAGGSHTHTANDAGAHNHTGTTGLTQLTADNLPSAAGTGNGVLAVVPSNGSATGHSHTIGTDGNHSHSINLVGDHTHTSLPPYLALCYIMKL